MFSSTLDLDLFSPLSPEWFLRERCNIIVLCNAFRSYRCLLVTYMDHIVCTFLYRKSFRIFGIFENNKHCKECSLRRSGPTVRFFLCWSCFNLQIFDHLLENLTPRYRNSAVQILYFDAVFSGTHFVVGFCANSIKKYDFFSFSFYLSFRPWERFIV